MVTLRFKKLALIRTALIFTTVFSQPAHSQSNLAVSKNDGSYQKAYFGFGLGLDYGGIGLRAEFLPSKYIGVFGGAGYNFQDISYNVGLSCKVLPDNRVTPVITAMYGYNGVIKIPYWSKTYFGPTVGAGCEIQSWNNENKLSLILFVPFRSADFHNRYNELKEEGYQFKPGVMPIAFSVGYNFALRNKSSKR